MSDQRASEYSGMMKAIPDPQAVRERLGAILREADILRKLLKVAEDAAKERQQNKSPRR